MAEGERQPIFQAPDRPINVPTRGLETLGEAGRMVGRLGNEAASMTRQAGEDIGRGLKQIDTGITDVGAKLEARDNLADITSGANTYAQAQLALAQQWKSAVAANPDDPNLAQNFLENNVRPALEHIQDGFQTDAGRRFGADHSDQMLAHWSNVLASGQAQAAGQAAAGNITQTYNALSATVDADPSHLPGALAQLAAIHNNVASTGVLSPETSAHIAGPALVAQQRELIATAAKATLDQNPNADLSGFYKSYGDRLGGEGIEALKKYQEQMQRVSKVQDAQNQKLQAATAQATADANAQQIYPTIYGALTAGTHTLAPNTLSQIMHSPQLTDDTKGALVGAAARITNGTAASTTSPDMIDGAISGLLQPTTSSRRATATNLISGVANGVLAPADANTLMTLNPEALGQLHDVLTYGRSALAPQDPGSGKVDPVRYAQYGQFQRWAMEQAAKGTIPELDKVPDLINSFRGYTLNDGVLTWGGQPITQPNQPPKAGIGRFFSGIFGGTH